MYLLRKTAPYLPLICFISTSYASSDVSSNQDETSSNLTVTVTENREQEISPKQVIDEQYIENTPSSNGNLTDYLKENPNIRFSQGDQDGFQGGEIKPESVSINGAEASQTSYMIDGININNDIDPLNEIFDDSMQVNPGKSSEQAYFFDANLLSGVTVYSSDVPANLGGFTGGAVVAKTRQYNGENRVKLRYRTTKSEWALMRVDDNAKNVVEQSVPNGLDADFQPKYKKDFFSISVEQGLTEDIGMVVGISRRESDIAQKRMINPKGDTDNKKHTRKSDNFLLNFNWTPDIDRSLELGFRFSDYQEGKYFYSNINNNVTDSHIAYGSTLNWSQRLGDGRLSTTIAFDKFFDKRDSSSNFASIIIDDNLFEYESGGYGDSQLSQKNSQLSIRYSFDPINLLDSMHIFSLGSSYRNTKYEFNRDHNVTQTLIQANPGGTPDPVKLHRRVRKGTLGTKYQDYSVYTQDIIQWHDFTVRPGIRIDKDNYLKNTNISPRLFTAWQASSDTRFNLGVNRYYGRSFSSMKLAGEVMRLNEDETRDYKSIDSLNTPYADELSIGISHNFYNIAFNANYIYRDNQDRISVKQSQGLGKKINTFFNGDDYHVDIYTLQISNINPWEFGYSLWNTSLSADWLKTDLVALNKNLEPTEIVELDGQLMTRADMQQKVNSSAEEWIIRLGLDAQVPQYDIVWSNKFYVKAPVRGYEELTNAANGTSRYKSYNFGTHTQWDTRLKWSPNIYGTHKVYLQLDILNVLDQIRQKGVKAVKGTGEYGIYSPGRQFWMELGYEF